MANELMELDGKYLNQTEFKTKLDGMSKEQLRAALDEALTKWQALNRQIIELSVRATTRGKQVDLIKTELDKR